MGGVWQYVLEVHRTGDLADLIAFYGPIIAFLSLVLVLVLLVSAGRRTRLRVDRVQAFLADLKGVHTQIDDLERSVGSLVSDSSDELEARMGRKLDQKVDLVEQRMDERTAALSDSISKLDARVGSTNDEIQRVRREVAEVESRIPNLFDKLDEFRSSLGKTFQAELGGVLNSFDSSVSAILEQMKAELLMGINRIESIESMVRGRERAEQALLGAGQAAERGEDFEEWEEEAKELAAEEAADAPEWGGEEISPEEDLLEDEPEQQ